MENMTQKAVQMGVVDEIKVDVDEIKVAAEPEILAIPGHRRYVIAGKDYMRRECLNRKHLVYQLRRSAEIVRRFTDKKCIDLERGVKTEELVSECWWKNECPKYVGYANDHIERTVEEFKDDGYAVKFIPRETVIVSKDYGALQHIPVEMVRELKAYALKFIPVETIEVLKDDSALKFIPAETVKQLKDEDYVKMKSGGMIEAVVNKCWWKNKCIEYVGCANDYIEKTVKPEMGLLFSGAIMQNIYQLVTSGMVTTGKGKTLMKLNEAAFMFLLYGLVMPRRAAGRIALAIGVALASAAYLVTMSFAL